MKRLGWIAATLFAFGFSAHAQTTQQPSRPNIVVIVVDDAGFSDFSAYGGEAHMPNIDALAQRGAMFSHYYTSPLCAPSRAMLLTGVDNHRTGVATIPEVLPPSQQGHHGYTMHLEPGVLTVAQRLQSAGYRTFMTGKWHLGHENGDLPNAHGFDRSFALDASGADNWQDAPYMPYNNYAPWFEDGKPAQLPADFYSSRFIVDRMIQYLDSDHRQGPFFAYLAFQAVHIPVQAPREYTQHYLNTYDAGWDALRQQRWRRVQALGLIPQGAPLGAMNSKLHPWSSLSPDDRALFSRSMAVYAGMFEAMDANIGRFISYLRAHNLADNTIFVVTSDNGPEPSDPIHETGFTQWMQVHGYTRQVSNLGEIHSYNFIGPAWASAAASPGDLFKFYAGDGGIHVPLIVVGPGIPQARINIRTFVTDIAPTLLDRAGVTGPAPAESVAMNGVSMSAVLSGSAAPARDPNAPVGIEVSGNSALFRGDYKLVRNTPPYGDNRWRLYNIAVDPGETRDLAAAQRELFASMQADYAAYARANGVVDVPADYNPQRQTARNALMAQVGYYWWALLIIGTVLLAILYFAGRFVFGALRKKA
ncbi:MAG: arylsulfatase [Terricaulis sp.]